MRRSVLVIVLAMVGLGCATTVTEIRTPAGDTYTIKAKSDALVEAKLNDGVELKVDNRGRPSFIETVFGALVIRRPELFDPTE